MTTKKQEQPHKIFEQAADPHGRIRLDRPFTGEEAAKQDEENRAAFEEERRKRFAGRG